MTWRLAKSLGVLRDQVNDAWPKRNKSADGTIGDSAHASRSSDHNPWVKDGKTGVVTAIDITHDPDNGPDCNDLAERLAGEVRVKYIIWNRKIASADKGWKWRRYTGSNPHNKHIHISVKSNKANYDNPDQWPIGGAVGMHDEFSSQERHPWWKRLWLRWFGGATGTYLGLSTLSDWQIAAVMMGGSILSVSLLIGVVMLFIGERGRTVVRSWIVRQFRD